MIMPILTDAVASFEQPTKVESNALRPSEWSVGEWETIIGTVASVLAWLYRHSIKAALIWLWNALKAPGRIAQIIAKIERIDQTAELALSLARITWRTIDRPIFQTDSMGMCIHCNPFMLRLLTRQEDEIVGSGWANMIHEEDRDMVLHEWSTAISSRRDFHLHYRWIDSTGQVIRILCNAVRIFDEADNILGWVGIVTVLEK